MQDLVKGTRYGPRDGLGHGLGQRDKAWCSLMRRYGTRPSWMDIQEKDKKKAKNKQNRARNGKDKVKSKPKFQIINEVAMDDAGEDVVRDDDHHKILLNPRQLRLLTQNDTSEPKTTKTPNPEWFKQPPRPPTPDPEWNKCQDPLTFNDLMATSIDFSKYVLNRLKIDNMTQNILLGPAYDLLKGTCTSSIKLEYNFQECFNALTDKLDWNNPEGDRYPFDLSKPLPLQVYSTQKILGVKSVSVKKLHGYGHLEEIVVKRAYRQLYKFKEGDFVDLHLNDIEEMLLLTIQHKLFHLNDSNSVDFIVALHMFTRSLVIKKCVEDLQLGVESYQKKLDITAPQKTFPEI
ncbi:hypothetical protein Tco_0967340 [Tanacetum coccineum]